MSRVKSNLMYCVNSSSLPPIIECVARKLMLLVVELRGSKLIYDTELPFKNFSVAYTSKLYTLVNTP